MPYFHEANQAPYQSNPEMTSPDRPPQLNEAVCGCHCGCGCGGMFEAPEQHVHIEAFAVRRPSSDQGNGINLREVRTRFGGFLNDMDGFRLSEHAMGGGDGPVRVHQMCPPADLDDAADSMRNEPCGSDDQSTAASDIRSVHCISPGPGLGSWAEEVRVNGYHFSVTPLRLTPQRRHCRGLVASRFDFQDEISLRA